jgi:hypothetical protein
MSKGTDTTTNPPGSPCTLINVSPNWYSNPMLWYKTLCLHYPRLIFLDYCSLPCYTLSPHVIPKKPSNPNQPERNGHFFCQSCIISPPLPTRFPCHYPYITQASSLFFLLAVPTLTPATRALWLCYKYICHQV